ncbi:unnamed protein product [Schistosoma rodhaini]|nr:unnamed protein product [Schistosoma rodhaini]
MDNNTGVKPLHNFGCNDKIAVTIFLLMAKFGKSVQIPLSWIPQSNGNYPENAISVGDGVFVVRSRFINEILPGKLVPKQGKCYCSHGGDEIELTEYEVLCDTSLSELGKGYEWVKSSNGEYPKHAIIAGFGSDGKPLYIAKGYVEDNICVGKLHEGHKSAYMPWGGRENAIPEYEWNHCINESIYKKYKYIFIMAKVGRGLQIPLSWIPGRDGFCPAGAVSVDNICVARSKYSGELLPGKLVPMNGKCYCPYGGAELEFYDYEVLCETFIPGSCKG